MGMSRLPRLCGLILLIATPVLATEPTAVLPEQVTRAESRPTHKPMLGLVIGGGAGFLVGWGAAVAVAIAGPLPVLAVPVVGAAIIGVQSFSLRDAPYLGVFFGVVAFTDAAIQLVGLTALTLGFVIPALRNARNVPRIAILPGAGGVMTGATVSLIDF